MNCRTRSRAMSFEQRCLWSSRSLVIGDVSCELIHPAICARSYVRPSAATTGSRMSSWLIGHCRSSDAPPRARMTSFSAMISASRFAVPRSSRPLCLTVTRSA